MTITKDRIRNLNEAFLYYADCQVATLETLRLRKSSSKSEIRRQTSIAQGMVNAATRYISTSETDLQAYLETIVNRLKRALEITP